MGSSTCGCNYYPQLFTRIGRSRIKENRALNETKSALNETCMGMRQINEETKYNINAQFPIPLVLNGEEKLLVKRYHTL